MYSIHSLSIYYPFNHCLSICCQLLIHVFGINHALDLAIINLSSINYPFATHISPHIVLCSSVCYRCTSKENFHVFSILSSLFHPYAIHISSNIFYCFHILSVSFHKVSHFRPNVQILSIVQPLYPAIIHLALCIIHVPSMLYPYKNTIPFLPIVHPCAIHRKSLLQDV